MPSRRKLLSKTKKFRRNAKTHIESDIPWFSFIFIDFSLDCLCKSVLLLIFHSKSDFFVFESNFLRDGIILFIESSCVVTAWTRSITPVIFRAWEIEIRCFKKNILNFLTDFNEFLHNPLISESNFVILH